jgi:hypothetical protein
MIQALRRKAKQTRHRPAGHPHESEAAAGDRPGSDVGAYLIRAGHRFIVPAIADDEEPT